MAARARSEAARQLRGADGAAGYLDKAAGADGGVPGAAGYPGGAAPGAGTGAPGAGSEVPGPGPAPARRRPARGRPGRKRVSPALRRLVVTPTFAAGLGVVVAAFLAANMSRTVLHFSAPIPGNQCTAGDCHVQKPHGGTLASAKPGVPITRGGPDRSGPSPGLRPGGTAPAAGGNGGPRPRAGGQPVRVTYRQVEQWPGGFADEITISGLDGTRARTWSLAFGYPGGSIDGVQGARWEPGHSGTGVARGVTRPGRGQPRNSTAPVRLMVIVEGRTAPPSGCTLDGAPCSFATPVP